MLKYLTFISLISVLCLTGCGQANINSTAELSQTASKTNNTTTMKPTHIAKIKTTLGTITAELYGDQAPETVKNFVTLAQENKYDGTPFHRIIPDFMIQTGDFEKQNGTGGYSYKGPGTVIPDEFHQELVHVKGALSMANRGPNTGGSQFFIVQAQSTPWLDGMHSVFGQVTDGIDIVDKIATVEKDAMDRPLNPILIESIEIE